MEPKTDAPTPTAPKWYDRPLVRAAAKYGMIFLVAFLASKGIHLPGELPPPVVVNVNATGPDAPAK
jgi:hypothetical protein